MCDRSTSPPPSHSPPTRCCGRGEKLPNLAKPSSPRRDLVSDLEIPPHRVRHMEALQRARHIGTRLALPLTIDVDHIALLELRPHAFSVPILDTKTDMTDRSAHAIGRT